MTRALFAMLLSAAALASATAAAQAPEEEADRQFRLGREALERREYARACEHFAESQRLDPGAGTLLNLAECSERLGDVARALTYSLQADEQLSATGDERAAIARENVKRLEPRVATIAVRVDALAPAGTRVALDDRELGLGELASPIVVNPGKHVVTIRRPGAADERISLSLAAGDQRDLVVGPERQPAAERPVPWLGIGIGALGVASLGVAAVTGVILLDKRSVVNDPAHCSRGSCDREGLDAADGGDALLVVNAVAWGVGVAGVGIGATLVILGTRDGEGDEGASAKVSARPGGLWLEGRF